MTPQEKDLITALLTRLAQAPAQPKDRDAEALIAEGLARQPDAPYLLIQTVLIQELALQEAQRRINELERQGTDAATAAPTSFLGPAGTALGNRGSVPSAGPWGRPAPAPPAAPSGPVWTQSTNTAAPPSYATPPSYPAAAPPFFGYGGGYGGGTGFLHQAAVTAAGVAGGALLFQGIESMFGPHYYGGMMGGMPMQPGLSETVINNYYGDAGGAAASSYDPGTGSDPGYVQADDQGDPGSADYADNQDFADTQDFGSDQDFGNDGGGFDV